MGNVDATEVDCAASTMGLISFCNEELSSADEANVARPASADVDGAFSLEAIEGAPKLDSFTTVSRNNLLNFASTAKVWFSISNN